MKFWLSLFLLTVLCIGSLGVAAYNVFDDTVWAEGYSNAGFDSVEVGMTHDNVRGALGEPLIVWQRSSFTVWDFTKSPNDSHYAIRQIEFDHAGRVREKIKMYWID